VNARMLCFVAIGMWLATAVVAIVILVRGQTQVAADGRRAIAVTDAERNLILTEMRGMLGSVRGVVDGLAHKDLRRVAEAARASGMATVQQVPLSLMAKLPLDFKQTGMETHVGFDALAAAADGGETTDTLLARLGDRLDNCVACHSAYRLAPEPEAGK
jgi:cytochrome c556